MTLHGHDVRLIRRYTSGGRVSSRPHDVQFGKPGPTPSLRQLQGVGAENSVTSCDLQILVYETTEAILS